MKRTKHIVNILTAAVTLLLTASCNVSYPDLDLPQGEPPTNDEDVNIDKTSILLYTSLVPWADGGSIDIDDDRDPNNGKYTEPTVTPAP